MLYEVITPVPLVYNEYPRGTNIAFRREVFERLGSFHTRVITSYSIHYTKLYEVRRRDV